MKNILSVQSSVERNPAVSSVNSSLIISGHKGKKTDKKKKTISNYSTGESAFNRRYKEMKNPSIVNRS